MNKEIITFGDTEIEKRKFHHRKNLILLEYVDIDSILTSSLVFYGEKKNINILLVTKMMIIKLNNFTWFFRKQTLM